MPSFFTATSELVVGFDILEVWPTEVKFKDVGKYFFPLIRLFKLENSNDWVPTWMTFS